ncbi:hypothetical protein AC249_AIPGENE17051 [Exaiptasia diaphana]|nr:hypothetical protein AC249_AIPGENE17051 [Exaiptasia diaphana]
MLTPEKTLEESTGFATLFRRKLCKLGGRKRTTEDVNKSMAVTTLSDCVIAASIWHWITWTVRDLAGCFRSSCVMRYIIDYKVLLAQRFLARRCENLERNGDENTY